MVIVFAAFALSLSTRQESLLVFAESQCKLFSGKAPEGRLSEVKSATTTSSILFSTKDKTRIIIGRKTKRIYGYWNDSWSSKSPTASGITASKEGIILRTLKLAKSLTIVDGWAVGTCVYVNGERPRGTPHWSVTMTPKD